MKERIVFCEVDESEAVLRIFNNTRDALELPAERVRQYPRAYAVGQIREFVLARCLTDEGYHACERCGCPVTGQTGHMHEHHAKGKRIDGVYGEVSRDNCEFLCGGCHVWRPDSAHGNRRWHSSILNNPA